MSYYGNQMGWAEAFLPIQTIQADSIQLMEPRMTQGGTPRTVSNLYYKHPLVTMQGCNVLVPFCKVLEWDSATGKLVLDIGCPTTLLRWKQIQQRCIDVVQTNRHWFPRTSNSAVVADSFQRFVTNQTCTLYLHGPNPEKALTGRVWCWKDGEWKKGVDETSFTKGDWIKVAMRLQGVCILPGQFQRNSYRIQHQVVAVYHKQTVDGSSSSSSSSSSS